MDETAKQVKEQVKQVQDIYEDGRRRLSGLAQNASEKSKQAFGYTDGWVRDNPWVALGIMAGIGLVIGLLVGRGARDED